MSNSVNEITNEVSTIMQTFINRLPKEKLGSRWDAKTME